jgi:hypothetical protein
MRRMAIALAAAALVAAGAAAAGGGPEAHGNVGLVAHDVFGLQTLELKQFEFQARGYGAGDAALGHFAYRELDDGAPTDARGPVWCMTVIGQDAWIGGTIQRSNDPSLLGLGGWWHVVDNGHGKNGPADITTFMGVGSIQQTQDFCDAHAPFKHPFDVQRGDVEVRAN